MFKALKCSGFNLNEGWFKYPFSHLDQLLYYVLQLNGRRRRQNVLSPILSLANFFFCFCDMYTVT